MNRYRERYNEIRLELMVIHDILGDSEYTRTPRMRKNRMKHPRDTRYIYESYARIARLEFIQEWCLKQAEKIENIEGYNITELIRENGKTLSKNQFHN